MINMTVREHYYDATEGALLDWLFTGKYADYSP